jgi:hypothetical protein
MAVVRRICRRWRVATSGLPIAKSLNPLDYQLGLHRFEIHDRAGSFLAAGQLTIT